MEIKYSLVDYSCEYITPSLNRVLFLFFGIINKLEDSKVEMYIKGVGCFK